MEFIIILLIIGGCFYYFKKKSKPRPNCQKQTSQKTPSKNANPAPTKPELKPSEPFNLTFNIEESVAESFQSILKNSANSGYWQAAQELLPIIARHNVRCQEVDDYIQKYRPIYLANIESQKKQSVEWKSAGELDKEDLLDEFEENALLDLEMRPDCDIRILFSAPDLDLTVDDALIERYDFSVISFYFGKKLGTYIIPSDNYERKHFECLVEAGLAIRGEDIPLESILEKMTLKEMSALVADLDPPKFSRKIKAIEYLAAVPDIKARLNKAISFRSVFMLVPLPDEFKNIDLDRVEDSWAYANEFTQLICKTYSAMINHNRNIKNYLDPDYGYKKFAIDNADECCPFCVKMAKKKYSRNNIPTIPLHIGCNCRLEPEYD